MKAGAREPPTAAAVLAAAVHDDDVVVAFSLFVDPAPVLCFGRFRLVLPLAVALLTGVLAPRLGEDSAANREAFILIRLNARPYALLVFVERDSTNWRQEDGGRRVGGNTDKTCGGGIGKKQYLVRGEGGGTRALGCVLSRRRLS